MTASDNESLSAPALGSGEDEKNSAGYRLISALRVAYGRTRGWVREFLDEIRRRKPASISYRYLARQLAARFEASERNPCIVFSSAESLEASCDVLMMIAYILHDELGARVLLVDGSLTAGGASDRFGYAGEAGLIDYFCESGDTLNDCFRPTANPGVYVLPAGKMPKQGRPAVQFQSVKTLLEKLSEQFDYVLIQQGSITLDTRYLAFAQLADLVLLYTEEGGTLVDEYEACQKIFRDYQIQNVGLIMLESGG